MKDTNKRAHGNIEMFRHSQKTVYEKSMNINIKGKPGKVK